MLVPAWDTLYAVASAQDGHFTTAQAAEAGYSRQLLAKYLANGKVKRVRWGIYRLVHFPPGEHEDLTVVWLWSGQNGVFSHETALGLHDLSDALPAKVHLTLPEAWRRRRLRVPKGVVLHFANVPKAGRAWVGPIPVTTPVQTLMDCKQAHVAPELVAQALRQARARGLVPKGFSMRTALREAS